ncbi:protein MgtS [Yersinia nurmii]|nr:protein MgtS [Yersinia nurmii]MDN0085820.1 protein MgtS [Yersinia nurmii]
MTVFMSFLGIISVLGFVAIYMSAKCDE